MPPHHTNQNDVPTVTVRRDEFNEMRGDIKTILDNQNKQDVRISVLDSQFATVRNIVFGGAGLALVAVGTALIALVVVK